MCGFVLLGGVHRTVPREARVMVHQIWLGDRRNDPTAANYTAEDLVLVQRDIGRLAKYTIEMGGSIDLLNLALRIPPWEPMHALTPDETRRTRLATDLPQRRWRRRPSPSLVPVAKRPVPRVTDGARATAISERRWALVEHAGVAALARRQPLTVEGEDIGSFDLMLACGAGRDSYDVNYVERRHDGDHIQLPAALGAVTFLVGRMSAAAQGRVLGASHGSRRTRHLCHRHGAGGADRRLRRRRQPFDDDRDQERRHGHRHSLRQYRRAAEPAAAGRAAGQKSIGDRADLAVPKTGGIASAK